MPPDSSCVLALTKIISICRQTDVLQRTEPEGEKGRSGRHCSLQDRKPRRLQEELPQPQVRLQSDQRSVSGTGDVCVDWTGIRTSDQSPVHTTVFCFSAERDEVGTALWSDVRVVIVGDPRSLPQTSPFPSLTPRLHHPDPGPPYPQTSPTLRPPPWSWDPDQENPPPTLTWALGLYTDEAFVIFVPF